MVRFEKPSEGRRVRPDVHPSGTIANVLGDRIQFQRVLITKLGVASATKPGRLAERLRQLSEG